jgi:hypothetical protein
MKYDALLERVIAETTRHLDSVLHMHDGSKPHDYTGYHYVVQSEEMWQKIAKIVGRYIPGNGLIMHRSDLSPWDPDGKTTIHKIGDLAHLDLKIDMQGQLWAISDEADAIIFKLTWC